MALLGLMVWYLNPRQPDFKPAPLQARSEECLKPGREFVPTNLTAVTDASLNALPAEKKNPTIFHLNTTACTCGCNLSLAYCHEMNSQCATSNQGIKQMVSDASATAKPVRPKKK
jgi:hypothetical protein